MAHKSYPKCILPHQRNPWQEIRTDASGSGWGATDLQSITGGRLNEVELERAKNNEINYFETTAINFGLKSFRTHTRNTYISLSDLNEIKT